MNKDELCGYCARCAELKDDDYGQWNIVNNEFKTARGCRECGHKLTTIETLEETLPDFLDELLSGIDCENSG